MEDGRKRILTSLTCVVMGCALGGVVTYYSVAGRPDPVADTARAAGTAKYEEIMDLVDTYYIGDDVDETAINDAMASGMISGLGDRWSYYISAEDYQSFLENLNNAYVGVGITIRAKTDDKGNLLGYEVSKVTEDGPAEEAGVQAGDVLTTVDGADVTSITLTEVKSLVKGEPETTVRLGFLRDGETVELIMERRALTVVPAKGQLLPGGVGYITITNFDGGCAAAVKGLVEELQDKGATSLLFDVRNNPGGLKAELTDLLDYLLPEGTIFHTVNYAGQEEIISSDERCVDLPMAVLVNASSYSAAEYFACALQEYGVGVVVGEQTFGKGYYQVGKTLSDGSAVNLSIGKYFTPNGKSLIGEGVTPDLEIPLTDEEKTLLAQRKLDPAEDPQVQAALGSLSR